MSTFVLVHGAWSGSNGFRHVRRLLQAEGHEVYTPSLTGIGERSHLLSPLINLSTHARDVANHVLYEDLSHITLVGFSYGGFVVSASLEHIADRIEHLVFLDAFVPLNGESLLGQTGAVDRARIELGNSWLVPPRDRHFDDPEEAKWVAARRGPQPVGCFTEAVYLSQPLEEFDFSLTYIKATHEPRSDPGAQAIWRAAEHAKISSRWCYKEIETTHMVASNRPRELADTLIKVARR